MARELEGTDVGYRVKTGRPVEHKVPEAFDAVRHGLRTDGETHVLAMAFDPGSCTHETLVVHAADVMLGLLYLRGWRHDGQQMRVGLARDWPTRWWDRPSGHAASSSSPTSRLSPAPTLTISPR